MSNVTLNNVVAAARLMSHVGQVFPENCFGMSADMTGQFGVLPECADVVEDIHWDGTWSTIFWHAPVESVANFKIVMHSGAEITGVRNSQSTQFVVEMVSRPTRVVDGEEQVFKLLGLV